MALAKTFAVLLILVGSALCEKVRYDNYKVFRIIPENRLQLRALKYLEENVEGLDFWKDVSAIGHPVDIMVSPENVGSFAIQLKKMRFQPEVLIENVQSLIDQETPRDLTPRAMDWTSYHSYDEITTWLNTVARQNSDIASIVNLGKSYEGRDILGIKLSKGGNKPAVFIDSAHHAREWISTASVTWFINELVTGSTSLLNNNDWYLVPVVNPDGYEFSRNSDRMWRKTRSKDGTCYGADPNRNYDYHWLTGGSSSSPCSDTYAGSAAFSESESVAVAEFLQSIGNVDIYLSFHSYGQYIMVPYGYTNTHFAFYNEHMRIGNLAAAAISQKHGTKYTVGNIVDVMYVASGGSIDWVKGALGTPTVFALELRDKGLNGFVLPPAQIIPTAEETWDGVVTIVSEAQRKIAVKN